jgi:NAD(P)-dependent dehydrogenase (short-subunit alcohol dehydrogenase family)
MSRIVITGANRGIGMGTAVILARAGHSVVATMRNPAAAGELRRVAADEKLPIQIEALDVDSDSSVKQCFDDVQAGGPVDALVNNAGIERAGPIEETPLQDFRACMETNYFGAVRCIQAVLPSMRERRQGVIVNVSSVAGKACSSPLGPYAASKYALEAVSEALAQEMRPFGVRVAVVEPGVTDTRMARNIESLPDQAARYPQAKRISALFAAILAAGAGTPEMVGEKIREIIESDTIQLRHPVGPGAAPLLSWRASMTDEQWTEHHSLDEASWVAAIKRDFGLDVKL